MRGYNCNRESRRPWKTLVNHSVDVAAAVAVVMDVDFDAVVVVAVTDVDFNATVAVAAVMDVAFAVVAGGGGEVMFSLML